MLAIGRILSMDELEREAVLDFDGGEVVYGFDEFDEVTHAYGDVREEYRLGLNGSYVDCRKVAGMESLPSVDSVGTGP